ncbi:MAG: TolC family protein [Gemmataceae bacterium]|nr:TolC family protein [Gemmataceae bacterium]
MMRWQPLLGLVIFALCGCGQTYFLREADYEEFHSRLQLPPDLETDPAAGTQPVAPLAGSPATVNDPEREPRFISLQECIAIALQNGHTGLQSLRSPGLANDDLVGSIPSSGGFFGFFGSDSIRVLSLQPAIDASNIDYQLARFDTQWTSGLSWTTTDEPTQGLSSFQNGQGANFNTSLAKPLPTGGVAGITFSTDYKFLASPPRGAFSVLSPAYTTRLQLGFEQPLLRNFGTEINQLLGVFPNSTLFPALNGRRTTDGILIARLRFDQRRADFERIVNYLLLNVETAYWNLYGSYVNLFSAEQALRLAHEAWRIGKARFDEGKIDIADFAPTRAQYEQFRGNRLQALGSVLEAERNLRTLLGLPVEDGKRLVPADAPTQAPVHPDWAAALQDALSRRPELILTREELKVRQFNLIAQRNFLKPDLRMAATYTAVGFGSRLDGNGNYIDGTGTPRTNNAFRALSSDHFNDWTVGLTLNVPLGFRLENAAVRQAKLGLAQAYYGLREQEIKAENALAKQYRQVLESFKVIEARRQERMALAEQVEARFRKYAIGKITIDFLLDSQRQWAAALSAEFQAVVSYNNALVGLEFAKGTIQQYDSIAIAEGPLPQCAQVRATDHERERTKALVLRERAVAAPRLLPAPDSTAKLPALQPGEAPSLPALLEGTRLAEQHASGPRQTHLPAQVGKPFTPPQGGDAVRPVARMETPRLTAVPSLSEAAPPARAGEALLPPVLLGQPTNGEPNLPLRPTGE